MVSCCPFLRRFTRRKSRSQRTNDQPEDKSENKSTHIIMDTSNTTQPIRSGNSKSSFSQKNSVGRTSSEEEYFECRSEFSGAIITSQNLEGLQFDPNEAGQPEITAASPNQPFNLWNWFGWGGQHRNSSHEREVRKDENLGHKGLSNSESLSRLETADGASCSTVDFGPRPGVLTACMNLMPHPRHITSPEPAHIDEKLLGGSTFERRNKDVSFDDAKECWEPADPLMYKIRSRKYIQTRIKEQCLGSFYEVIGSDLYSFDKKQGHVAQFVKLPVDPYFRTAEELDAIHEYNLPSLLVVNMQLPTYQPTILGSDGRGHSFIFYCVLRKNFNPRLFENQASLRLFQRFVLNPENQSQYRIKLIPKFLNIEEWATKGPLTSTEHRLVKLYNEKPILTRQYNRFFEGPGYFEIDVDVHNWHFIAKKAFWALLLRMHEVVTEVALLIQGNHQDDLPEYLVSCARVYRVNLSQLRYFSSFKLQNSQKINQSRASRRKQGNEVGVIRYEGTEGKDRDDR